jgi:hypothetical protein
MTPHAICMLLSVHYITFFDLFISQWFPYQFTQTKILPMTSDVQGPL